MDDVDGAPLELAGELPSRRRPIREARSETEARAEVDTGRAAAVRTNVGPCPAKALFEQRDVTFLAARVAVRPVCEEHS